MRKFIAGLLFLSFMLIFLAPQIEARAPVKWSPISGAPVGDDWPIGGDNRLTSSQKTTISSEAMFLLSLRTILNIFIIESDSRNRIEYGNTGFGQNQEASGSETIQRSNSSD